MGRQMDHRLAHGRLELRNVRTWNCSTIRSPWADSCYQRTSPHCFSRIFPIPCGTQVSLVDAAGRSRLWLGWGQMPALAASEDAGLVTAPPRSGPEHMAALCSTAMLLPAETRAGRRQRASDFTSSMQLGSGWAVLTQGMGSASGSTSLDRPQAGSTVIDWFDRENHPSLGSKHMSHTSSLFASHIQALLTASVWCFLTFQQ